MRYMLEKIRAQLIDHRDTQQKADSMISILVVGMLFTLPLIPAVLGQGYEQIKVLFFLAVTTFIGAGWIYRSAQNPARFKIKFSALQIGLIIFLGSLFMTSAIGVNFQTSLLGNPPYFQGLIVYLYCYLWFLIVSTTPVKVKAFYLAWVLSSVIVAAIAVVQWVLLNGFQITIPNYAGRVVSTFGQPSLYSGYLLLTLPMLIVLVGQSARFLKKTYILAFVLITLGITVSQSRGAIVLVIGLLLLLVWNAFRQSSIKYGMVLGILLVLSLGIFITYKGEGLVHQEVVRPLVGTGIGQDGQERRAYIWLFITDIIQKKPITGYGLDNLIGVFPTAMNELNPKPAYYFTVKNMTVDRAHNYLLDLLVSGGIVVFSAWMVWYFLLIAKAKSRWELVFLGIFFIYLQFQIQSIVHLVLFYTVAGLINRYDRGIPPLTNSSG